MRKALAYAVAAFAAFAVLCSLGDIARGSQVQTNSALIGFAASAVSVMLAVALWQWAHKRRA